MRELFLVRSESTESSLVFRTSAEQSDSGDQFFFAVDDGLRAVLLGEPTPEPASEPVVEETAEAVEETVAPPPKARVAPTPRPQNDPDPRLSAPMTMRPREIQDRVRAGASTAELAEEMGVTEARVEPFAHPVLLERGRVAEMAKQAHPVRDDGPAKLTLWEVLATAFAARGSNLAAAGWDAFRDDSAQWVIRVSWQAGHSENLAEWTLQNHATSSPTAVPRNAVAADLTDPDFVQPVRSLTSIGGNGRYYEDLAEESAAQVADESPTERTRDDIAVVREPEEKSETAESEEELREPEPEQAPAKRRRRAVTPHWEDVLLGVRTNTKRPKN